MEPSHSPIAAAGQNDSRKHGLFFFIKYWLRGSMTSLTPGGKSSSFCIIMQVCLKAGTIPFQVKYKMKRVRNKASVTVEI